MIENKTTSDCTIYAFVGTAILAISLVVAMYVGNDFLCVVINVLTDVNG